YYMGFVRTDSHNGADACSDTINNTNGFSLTCLHGRHNSHALQDGTAERVNTNYYSVTKRRKKRNFFGYLCTIYSVRKRRTDRAIKPNFSNAARLTNNNTGVNRAFNLRKSKFLNLV